MVKKVLYGFVALAIFIGGFLVSKFIFEKKQREHTEQNATVLLDKVEQVFKLVTVEGNFVETYDQLNTKSYTIYLPFPSSWSFPKSASVEVKGKVLVGYDMEGVTMTLDSTSKQIIVNNMPKQAEILAIDHELAYKNLKESYFNSFKPSDYTKLNANAKQFLRQKAMESRLMTEAEDQGNQTLQLVKFMAESAGWTVVVNKDERLISVEEFLD